MKTSIRLAILVVALASLCGEAVAQPTFIGYATGGNSGLVSSWTVSSTLSAGTIQTGDQLVMVNCVYAGTSVSSVTGGNAWGTVHSTAAGTSVETSWLSRAATGSEPSSYTVTTGAADGGGSILLVYRGSNNVVDVSRSNNGASSTTLTIPGVTTTHANDKWIAAACWDSAILSPIPSGLTQRWNAQLSVYFGFVGDETIATASSTGSPTGTLSVAKNWTSVSLALEVATGTPTPTPTPSATPTPNIHRTSIFPNGANGPCIYPPDYTSLLQIPPPGITCLSGVVDALNTPVYGATPVAGGSLRGRVIYDTNQSAWIFDTPLTAGSPSPSPTASPTPAGQLVGDHAGITGQCTGTAGAVTGIGCTYSQPVTCSCTAGNNWASISGYTPTSADIGTKDIAIGMSWGIAPNSTSFAGAGGCSQSGGGHGGSQCFGIPLRVKVGNVNNHGANTIEFGAGVGTSPTTCQNTVTNAECDIGTNNSPIMQTLVNAGNVTIGPGNYMFDGPGVSMPSNVTVTCQPGAIIVDPRNDYWSQNGNQFFNARGFYWNGTSNGGFVGPCTFLGTNTSGALINTLQLPNINHFLYPGSANGNVEASFSRNITIGGLTPTAPQVHMFGWGDSTVALPGVDNSNVKNIIAYVNWAFGPSIIYGNGNTFTNITGIDNSGLDIEPNDPVEADETYNNVVNNFSSILTGTHGGGPQVPGEILYTSYSGGSNVNCNGSVACRTGQTVENGTIIGFHYLYPSCVSGTAPKPWISMTKVSNGTGAPACTCDSGC